jgi:hypothetical protein
VRERHAGLARENRDHRAGYRGNMVSRSIRQTSQEWPRRQVMYEMSDELSAAIRGETTAQQFAPSRESPRSRFPDAEVSGSVGSNIAIVGSLPNPERHRDDGLAVSGS